MPKKKVLPNLTGGHVLHQSPAQWYNKSRMASRRNQVRSHISALHVRAEVLIPKQTRYIIAIHGDINAQGATMQAFYQSTAEMMFIQDWRNGPVDERPNADGWLIVERGTTP